MKTPVRFYADEHISRAVIRGLRHRGIDALTVSEAGLQGADDEEQLARALAEGRVLLTQDSDFLRLGQAGLAHAGIAYARQGTAAGEIIRGLVLLHAVLGAEDMKGHVEFL